MESFKKAGMTMLSQVKEARHPISCFLKDWTTWL